MRDFLRQLKWYVKQFPFVRPRGLINFFDYINSQKFHTNWYNSSRDASYTLIEPQIQYVFSFNGKLVDHHSKENVFKKLLAHRIKTIPPFYTFTLANAYVFSNEGLVLTPNQYVIDQSTHYFGLKVEKSRFFKPFYFFSKNKRKISGNVAVLATNGSSNYYHWLIDALPRLIAYERFKEVIDYYVIPSNHTNAHIETLILAGISKEKILPLGPREKIECDQVIFSSIPSAIGTAAHYGITFVRELVLGTDSFQTEKTRKLYISRANANWRKINNETALINELEKLGFENYIFDEKIDVKMQAKLFNEAKIIIAPHGASLANLVFANNCTVYELINPSYFSADCFFTLAKQNEVDYCVIVGKPEDELNYSIDIDELVLAIKENQMYVN